MAWNKRKIEGALGAWAFGLAKRLLNARSPQAADRWGARLGRLTCRLVRKRRERVLGNLRLAFPEWTDERRNAVALQTFEHFGKLMADFLRADRRDPLERAAQTRFHGLEHLTRAIEAGKGALLVAGHFGNWERMGEIGRATGRPLSVVVRDANNPAMNAEVDRLRRASGFETISRGNAARFILQKLRANELVGILCDQNTDEAFVPFFGKPCGTVVGPATLGKRTGAPLIPVYPLWREDGTVDVYIEPPLEPLEGYDDPILGMTAAIAASLEARIRQHPAQYLWLHDRWKSARQRGML